MHRHHRRVAMYGKEQQRADLRWRARQKFFSQRRHGKSDRKCRDSPPMSLENKHEAQIRVLKMLILSEI